MNHQKPLYQPHAFLWKRVRRRGSVARIQAIEQQQQQQQRMSADELDAALMQATVDGNLAAVQRLVARGANRHVQHSQAMLESHVTYNRDAFDTPLEAAAWLGHDDIVRYFLKQRKTSSRRLLFARNKNSRRHMVLLEQQREESSREFALDYEAFLVACQGGTLATVQAFVLSFGPSIITQQQHQQAGKSGSSMTPLHYACARCHVPLMQYLMQHGARLDCAGSSSGAAPIFWLGMFVEMKRIHGSSSNDNAAGCGSPIPLPLFDDLSDASYEAAMAWVIQHNAAALLVTDHRGTTALERLLKRAPLGLIRTAIVNLVGSEQPTTIM